MAGVSAESLAGFHVTTSPDSEVDDLLEDLVSRGFVVGEVEGSKMTTELGAYAEFSVAFQFPSPVYGAGAFDDWMTDLEWLPTKKGYIVAIHDPVEVMADEPDDDALPWFVRRMVFAREQWSHAIDDRQWSRPAYPFIVILIDPAGESAATALWEAAGAELTDLDLAAVRRIRGSDFLEPPPYGAVNVAVGYSAPIPFGSPPPEDVTLVGDIPWELRDGDSSTRD